MSHYATIALNAIQNILSTNNLPGKAWDEEESKLIPSSNSSSPKDCPRSAFLGLCSSGLVKNIPAGNYTRSIKSRAYAVTAYEILKADPSKANNYSSLWKEVLSSTNNPEIEQNQQMSVVCALFNGGHLI